MLEHLGLDEIAKMPVHMQILYYLEKWGSLVQTTDKSLDNLEPGGGVATDVSSGMRQAAMK